MGCLETSAERRESKAKQQNIGDIAKVWDHGASRVTSAGRHVEAGKAFRENLTHAVTACSAELLVMEQYD
jgi:hypothetical protein